MTRNIFKTAILVLSILGFAMSAKADPQKPLVASFALIHGAIDSVEEGLFVDLVRALEPYTGRKINIELFPFQRSIYSVQKGAADFHLPSIRNPDIDESRLPYRSVSEKLGTVTFVIYSRIDKPLTKGMIEEAMALGPPFPYLLEGPSSFETALGVPCLPSQDIALSLQKIANGKIDGLIWPQEGTDEIVKKLKLASIHREHWRDFDSTILIAQGPESDAMDALLSDAIRKAKAVGKLDAVFSRIHHKYDSWQPYEMGWSSP